MWRRPCDNCTWHPNMAIILCLGGQEGVTVLYIFKGQDVKVQFKSAQKECNKTRETVHDMKTVRDLK